jgi:plasmid stabilization system protein ParE
MKSSPQKTETDDIIDSRIDSINLWINHLRNVSAQQELINHWQDKVEILKQAKEIINDKGNGW